MARAQTLAPVESGDQLFARTSRIVSKEELKTLLSDGHSKINIVDSDTNSDSEDDTDECVTENWEGLQITFARDHNPTMQSCLQSVNAVKSSSSCEDDNEVSSQPSDIDKTNRFQFQRVESDPGNEYPEALPYNYPTIGAKTRKNRKASKWLYSQGRRPKKKKPKQRSPFTPTLNPIHEDVASRKLSRYQFQYFYQYRDQFTCCNNFGITNTLSPTLHYEITRNMNFKCPYCKKHLLQFPIFDYFKQVGLK